MVVTTKRKKIEILVDAPLLNRIRAFSAQAGVSGYSVFPILEGEGGHGGWQGEQVTGGAGSKVLFSTILDEERAQTFLGTLQPLLEEYGLIVTLSNVEVIRAERF